MNKYKYNVQAEGYKKKKVRNRKGKIGYYPTWSNLYNGVCTKKESAMLKVKSLKRDESVEKIIVYKILLETKSSYYSGRQLSSGIYTSRREVTDYDREEIYNWERA